jgi:hypothetical protein
MVIRLDGLEKVIQTINPETLELDTYKCVGYYNTGRIVNNKLIPGKLIDWYLPISKKGEPHSEEYLKLCAEKYKREYGEKYER